MSDPTSAAPYPSYSPYPAPTWGPSPLTAGVIPGGPNGQSISMTDPGAISPGSINPYAAQYLNNLSALYGQAQNSMLSPEQYQRLQSTQEAQLTSSLGNQYARMGLSGSSAEMGGLSQAINQNQMNWLNRQQSDYMKYNQMMGGLNQMGYGDTMGIQGQYGKWQDVYAQDILGSWGIQNQASAANQGMWGQIIGGGLGGLGTLAGFLMSGSKKTAPDSVEGGGDAAGDSTATQPGTPESPQTPWINNAQPSGGDVYYNPYGYNR